MADRSPDPDRSLASSADETTSGAEPTNRSLTHRWWWQAVVIAVTGAAIIGFQWEVISQGESIAATWVMVGIGAVAVDAGAAVWPAWTFWPSCTTGVTAPANGAAIWPGVPGSAFSAAAWSTSTDRSRTWIGRS